jgi:ribose 5-phosphate isomerase A
MTSEQRKREVAHAALAELPREGVIGIGTGTTTRFFIEELSRVIARGAKYVGVPTSDATRRMAHDLGIPLLDDAGPWDIAVCVDGADEVDPQLALIKGHGGALTREKIVNYNARTKVIIVDDSKLSAQLGMRESVPVEVEPFGHRATQQHLAALGTPTLRVTNGAPFRTDNGNLIIDIACGAIADPRALDLALRAIPGVVETGLFVARVDVVLVGYADRVERLVRT